MKAEFGQVVLVDGGNFFPEDDLHQDVSWFLMDAMKLMDVRAVGLSPNEFRFGYGFLKHHVARTQLPVTSANLVDVRTKKTAFAPYLIEKVGNVRVGYFSLMNDKQDLGGVRDSLRVEEPAAVARRVVPEMRKKGATVVVLLSQLGKVESEDLVTVVPGIDAVLCGRNVPMIAKGRMIKSTIAAYGGEQGQYLSRTIVTVDKAGKVLAAENESFMLGPEVGERSDMQKLVKAFEDDMNEKVRKSEKERAAAAAADREKNADHFVGVEVCARCHKNEYEQWKTTSHSIAWHTLVNQKADTKTECIGCHVVGYQQNGGFKTAADVEKLSHVQCESCHGMGTRHEAFAAQDLAVAEKDCLVCHTTERDPGWNFEKELPMVAHGNFTGVTIKGKQLKDAIPADVMGAIEKGHSGGR